VSLILLAAAPGPWQHVETEGGVELYQRELPGERVVELKAVVVSKLPVERLCEAAYGPSAVAPDEPDITLRRVVSDGDGGRVTYERISAPVVSDRDYAVRSVREALSGGGCRVRFFADNALAPPPADGLVRIEKLRGSWTFEPTDAGVIGTYVIFTDPGGALPAVLIEGSRKKTARRWVALVLARAAAAADGGVR
jgi:hypothetical protein